MIDNKLITAQQAQNWLKNHVCVPLNGDLQEIKLVESPRLTKSVDDKKRMRKNMI